MQAITLEVILRAVFGVEDDRRRTELRRNLVGILATTRSPLAIGLTVESLRRLPRYRRMARMLAETDRLLFAEIAERRADPDLGLPRGHPLAAGRRPVRGRLRGWRTASSAIS